MDQAVRGGVGCWSPVNISVTLAWHTNEASRKVKLSWKVDGWGCNPACPFASSLIFPGVRLASDSQFSDFLDGLGPAQLVGRQTLATPAMGKSDFIVYPLDYRSVTFPQFHDIFNIITSKNKRSQILTVNVLNFFFCNFCSSLKQHTAENIQS